MRLPILVALAVWALAPAPAAAALYGLVIGVDEYVGTSPLRGAVNDAGDIADVLKRSGAAQVEVLLNRDATRANVLSAWERLIGRAEPDDVIVFSFAGHGAQEPDSGVLDEPDGLDEVFLLQPFAEDDDALFAEKLIDDELAEWSMIAEERGVVLLLVFDACHSGIPVRGVDPRAASEDKTYSGFRFTRYATRPTDPAKVDSGTQLASLAFGDNVVALGATDESLRVREERIEGQPRGVLSWALARGLEGSADANKDKVIASDELVNYVRRTVFDQARHRQIPQFALPTRAVRLLSVQPDQPGETVKPGDETDTSLKFAEAPAISVFAGGDLDGLDQDGVSLAADRSQADYIWDAASGDLIDDRGDVVAFGMPREDLPTAFKAQRLRRAISTLIEDGNALDVNLSPDNRLHCVGQTLTISGQSKTLDHYTAFNITGEGEIQFLWPVSRFNDAARLDGPWSFDTTVGAPFGADAVVLIAADQPLDRLHAVLEYSSQVLDPLDLWKLMQTALNGVPFEIAVQGIFTRDRRPGGGETCEG